MMLDHVERPNDGTTYEIDFEYRPDYLYALVSGAKDNLQISRNTWAAIAAECRAKNYERVLIDEPTGCRLSFMDMFQFAAGLLDLGFRGIKIAYVDPLSEHKSREQFGENVAINRGVAVRVFGKAEEAEEWLLV